MCQTRVMFNHSDIWRAVDNLAKANRLSTSGLAKKAGLDPTTFNKSKRITATGKLRWPSTESISKILFVTQTPLSDFMEHLSGEAMQDHWLAIPHLEEAAASRNDLYKKDKTLNTAIMDDVSAPFSRDQEIISFEISSRRFEPQYKTGDILIVDLRSDQRKGDQILLKTRVKGLLTGLLKKETTTQIFLELATGVEEKVDRNDIDWMGRILWVSQ